VEVKDEAGDVVAEVQKVLHVRRKVNAVSAEFRVAEDDYEPSRKSMWFRSAKGRLIGRPIEGLLTDGDAPIRRWFRDPLFLLALAAGLIAFVVQSES